MPQNPMRAQPRGTGVPAAPARSADLVATVQHLVFEPGLYTLHISAAKTATTDLGVVLPCVRLESVPSTPGRPGRANVVNTREAGWLSPSEEPSFVLVVGGEAGAILTVYRANDGMPAPEIRLRHVFTGHGDRANEAQARRSAERNQETPAVRIAALAHVSGIGDMADNNGNWVGRVGSGSPVEGFALTPGNDVPADAIEYQAILGNNWNTPWFRGGEFCGSRGLMLPLLGFRIQLKGAAAEQFDCQYFGQFVGGRTVGPLKNGDACASDDHPLEALRVMLVKKTEALAEPPKAAAPAAAMKAASKPAPPSPAAMAKRAATKSAPAAQKAAPAAKAKPAARPVKPLPAASGKKLAKRR